MKHLYSRETPVGVYPPNDSEPEDYISIAEARVLRKTGDYFSINSGKDIRRVGAIEKPVPENFQKSKWIVRPSGLQAIGFVDVLQLV